MDCPNACEIDGVADTIDEDSTSNTNDAAVPTHGQPPPAGAPILVTVPSAFAMGCGDAPLLFNTPGGLTAQDIEGLILPDQVVNLLPVIINNQLDIDNSNNVEPTLDSANLQKVTAVDERQQNDGSNIGLTSKDIYEIQNFCENPEGLGSEVKIDLLKLEVLFRCESCQEMPISSETVHTCDWGHQVCGCCYNNGIRMCVLCRGHLLGNNVPLENVLRTLREHYPHMFNKTNPPESKGGDVDYLSRFYSLKPLECPENGCKCKTTARSLSTHFEREHTKVPKIEVPLFKPCKVSLPQTLLQNVAGSVIAVVVLNITDEEIKNRLCSDTMTCWVQCGPISIDKDEALALWVSCVYEDKFMPPIFYSLRVVTANGYSSFGGQMTPLHDYKDPKSVLLSGKCLLLLPNDIEEVIAANQGSFVIELKFYLR